MHEGELSRLALSAGHEDLRLPELSTAELESLSVRVSALATDPAMAPDGALALRFEWLQPMIDAELRTRDATAG
ncbi:hypothetical protein VD659_02540 [Herbiconiux sp. 11R-BC]|uniref:hypothetical protein n=1 Tax=Herbiconiux sp. 11R-BC TaxID=3111637 RepID=UPI003C0EFD95